MKDFNPLVTVIIPMYNRENTILAAVTSVLNQTYRNLELIVVDDCSTDNSVKVVKQLDDDRIRLILSKENKGACVARNIGIECAKGEYIAFHDSDDIWHKNKLEKSLYYIKKTKADMVFSSLYKQGEKKYPTGRIIPRTNLNDMEDKVGVLLGKNCISTQTIVLKKEIIEHIRFDETLPRFQDWDFALQIALSGYKIYFIEEPLVDCYELEDSITKNGTKAVKAYEILEKKYQNQREKNKKAKYTFYSLAGNLLEQNKISGASYFKKAYEQSKKRIDWLRYILAKVRLFRFCTLCADKLHLS
ncbi:glycosyltransferase family 2 protein [Claveliimonas bilis]|uniref:Glycosyl transferase n=1 Tax=Claveliimonas bilis TaxID=3028070 RepID=A0ABM8I260_9FIRM|nr:glycosyltransferase family 2 protein [Claveliimonas bilis]BDZ77038.1 glycosyl transferase [Claveliimonas bilis]